MYSYFKLCFKLNFKLFKFNNTICHTLTSTISRTLEHHLPMPYLNRLNLNTAVRFTYLLRSGNTQKYTKPFLT